MTDEQRLQAITEQLIIVRDNLFRGMSKSMQKLQARSINEVLELPNFTQSLTQPKHDCARSHPHEEMSKECELRTEIARLRNQLAQTEQEPVADSERSDAYDRIDRFLRNSLHDEGYADLSADLELVWATPPQPKEPEQEPVAHCTVRPLRGDESYPKTEIIWVKGRPVAGPLYTTPPQTKEPEQEPDDLTIAYMAGFSRGKDLAPQRTWVDLTDEDWKEIFLTTNAHTLPKAIEAKLKEKNT